VLRRIGDGTGKGARTLHAGVHHVNQFWGKFAVARFLTVAVLGVRNRTVRLPPFSDEKVCS